MEISVKLGRDIFKVNLNEPLDISIPLIHDKSPIAFGAPVYESTPVQAGSFIGALEKGAPVNFYNLKINPHGNGTHTESVLHINKKGKNIFKTLTKQHFIAKVITVKPSKHKNGDRVVDKSALNFKKLDLKHVEALVIRTRPNVVKKKSQNYTGKNPIYFSHQLLKQISDSSINHLLIDVPSVDREVDGGRLKGHNAFWNTKGKIRVNKTITELIFVDNTIMDGLYLLNLQIIP